MQIRSLDMQKPGHDLWLALEGQFHAYVSVLLFRNDQHTFLTNIAFDLL